MKKSTKSPMKKPVVKKAQMGKSVKPTADSTNYFDKKATKDANTANKLLKEKGFFNDETKKAFSEEDKSVKSLLRQYKKGKPGYDANGFPLKKKMKTGGVVKKSSMKSKKK